METRVQLFAVALAGGMFFLVFELVRRKRLMERYALLWLFSAAVLLGLAVWRDLLEEIAAGVGIYYAPSALFAIAFACMLVLLLHFSLVISRLADQSKLLAQRLAILQQRVDELEGAQGAEREAPPVAAERDVERVH